ncbi:DUF6327 family protein [Polaribacter sp. P097]|uniref:DUF6327 family protein n=1 Tax=Polaribacter sp. P097 TaxID=3117398 RepID=UPI002FE07FF4
MKSYQNFEQIEYDLKVLNLERQIAYQELKGVKQDFEETLKPMNILGGALKFLGKYGALLLVKKFFK